MTQRRATCGTQSTKAGTRNPLPFEPAMQDRAPSITTPAADVVMTGGLSIVGMSALLVWALGFDGNVDFVSGEWLVPTILLNATHFTASYRLLYVSKAEILANRWSAIFVPGLLLALLAVAAADIGRTWIVSNLVLGSSVYLAWHYTGQAWGMVSAFSRILGIQFTELERHCIRGGMRVLLVLHVLYAFSGRLPPADWIDPRRYAELYGYAFNAVVVASAASLLIGGGAFWTARRRTGRLPFRVVFPWLALYVWYPFWYFVPGGFLWVQLSHALQYLAFPLRVEANRYTKRAVPDPPTSSQVGIHIALVFGALVLVGASFLHGPPLAAHAFGHGWYSTPTMQQLFQGFVACVAIHHYFVDGAVWKLSNPRVRGELLSHLS